MASITFKDMTLSMSPFGGDVTVKLRTLTKKISKDDLLALLYPIFDKEEQETTKP